MTSGHDLPIFLSSTEYDLIDLKAELASFLDESGYRSIVSSHEGFPSQPAPLRPWESCLSAIDTCFVLILVVDGRYGQEMEWPNFPQVLTSKDERISPTHGEYRYAKIRNKRILVFVRRSLMTDYARYRELNKEPEHQGKPALYLSNRVQMSALSFINEIKTTQPIPWIKEFDSVVDIKKEIRQQLLNELASAFREREAGVEALLGRVNSALQAVSDPEQRRQFLEKIGIASELIREHGESSAKAVVMSARITELEKSLIEANSKGEGEKTKADRLKEELRVSKLESEKLKKDQEKIFIRGTGDSAVKANLSPHISGGATAFYSTAPSVPSSLGNISVTPSLGATASDFFSLRENLVNRASIPMWNRCDKCRGDLIPLGSVGIVRRCSSCSRQLCYACFGFLSVSGKCADCSSKGVLG